MISHKKKNKNWLFGSLSGEKITRDDIYELACHFLKRRNTVHSKYVNSDLQKIEEAMMNLPLKEWKNQAA